MEIDVQIVRRSVDVVDLSCFFIHRHRVIVSATVEATDHTFSGSTRAMHEQFSLQEEIH